jgi:hypothetical protein
MLRPCSAAIGPVLSTILVVPVCYGPSMAVGSSNYIEIGQSSNWLRTDRGTSLNVGAATASSTNSTPRSWSSSERVCGLQGGLGFSKQTQSKLIAFGFSLLSAQLEHSRLPRAGVVSFGLQLVVLRLRHDQPGHWSADAATMSPL